MVVLLNLVGFFISNWPLCSFGHVLYHSCNNFERASRVGQPLNIFTWFIGAGGETQTGFLSVLFFVESPRTCSRNRNKYFNTIVCPKLIIVHTDTWKVTLQLRVLFYSSFVYTCACVFLHNQSSLRECRSIWSGASGLPYYCAPLVCVSQVMQSLAVWQHNKPKTKNWEKVCQRRIAQRLSQSRLWRALLGRTLGFFGAFPTLVGGHHWSLGATFLGS